MSSKIEAKNLSKTIMSYLEDYVEDIEGDVETVTNNITKEALEDLKNSSPKQNTKKPREDRYYKGWARATTKIPHKYVIKIHNKTNYQLTHLLEFGHATRNGGVTKAQTHIRPVEEKYKKIYEAKLETAIRRR